MKIYHSINDFIQKERCTILTIGTFDGVHLGHRKIIERLNELKAQENGNTALLTFFPHPRRVITNGNAVKMLTTMDEKIMLLEKSGLDNLIIEPFTEAFSQIPAAEFVSEILVKKLGVKKLVIGYDHQFGKNREGNYAQLQKLGKKYGFTLEQIPVQDIEDITISSTKIRTALEQGAIETANRLLGYPYMLTGKVVKGEGIGKKIQYPTINLHIKETYKLIPKAGVYIVKLPIDNRVYYGIMNIGNRPTLNGKQRTIEIHILDFSGDLYEKTIRIFLLKRLRDEQKFESLQALTAQIQKDELTARNWLMKKS